MTREVYSDKEFINFSRSQIFIRVFQDTEPQGARLAEKFGIEGFPTLIVLNPSGHEVDRIEGFTSVPDLIDLLKEDFHEDRHEGRISL
jgi:thiol-disulfide isomerase/thioredoxin